jgi:hypothetical protein
LAECYADRIIGQDRSAGAEPGGTVEITECAETRSVLLIEKTNDTIGNSNDASSQCDRHLIPTIFLSTPILPSVPIIVLRSAAEVESRLWWDMNVVWGGHIFHQGRHRHRAYPVALGVKILGFAW